MQVGRFSCAARYASHRAHSKQWRLTGQMLVSNKKPADAADDGLVLDRALADPVAAFDEPERIVRHPQLSPEQKREILRRWALEIYRTDCAKTRAIAQKDFARLDKVIDALIDLDEPPRALFKHKRRLAGGDVEQGKANASFKNGALSITLPKSERAKQNVRRIAINGKS